jgi:hypothetical protein
MAEETPSSGAGVIRGQQIVDLTSLTSPEQVAAIRGIEDVQLVLVPESLRPALLAVPMHSVQSVVTVPAGGRLRVTTGEARMGGEGLAAPGGEKDVLVVTGSLIITSPVEHVGYSAIWVTGLVLAPKGSEAALAGALTYLTGSVMYYEHAEGQRIQSMAGQTTLDGAAFANEAGGPNDILMIAGQLVITSPVEKVGFQHLIVSGQLVAPKASEAVLTPVLTMAGQTGWYSGTPRLLIGQDTFSRGFFELFDEPVSLVLVGKFVIDPDVPPALLKEKVSEIVLVGKARAPRATIPVLQFLTTQKLGRFLALEDEDDDGESHD